MKDLEPNKIFAAILVAGIVASLAGFIATKTMAVAPLKQNAFKIEGVASAPGEAAPVEEKAQPILDMIATADVSKGAQISKICSACHVFDKGGPNGLGPNLWGVVGRPKGSHPGYDYSDGMKHKGGNWTYEDLNQFIYKPKAYVDGTKMGFVGLKKPADRAAIIAWLRTLSDSPVPEPTVAEIAQEKKDLGPQTKLPANQVTSTTPKSGSKGAQPETAPGAAAADSKVKLNGPASATAAAPEGNAGTGAPESNPKVDQGAKPVDNGTEKTPQEKFDNKLSSPTAKGDQGSSAAPADQIKVAPTPAPAAVPPNNGSPDQNSGPKTDDNGSGTPSNTGAGGGAGGND
jgi:cytochrome c